MDIDWEKYKGILKRAYFTENSFIPRDGERYDDFWKFFKQYQAMLKKKNILSERRPSSSEINLNELGVPTSFDKYNRQIVNFELDKPARYLLREVPEKIVAEFEFALSSYVAFCQREKFQKLKKLRHAQRSLPIYQFREEIINVVAKNSIVVVAGDTGCGKSTQVPQYLLESGFQRVACTQPRRIACVSLAKRVAFETLNEYGDEVAYQIRFEKTRTSRTRLLFLTEGLLLRQLSTDPDLSNYDVVILDEIHERHLHGDFLLGVLKNLVQRRPEMKLILMSATINLELFSGYFQGAPIVQVPGRLYPIKLHYRPLTDAEAKSERIDTGPYRNILHMIDEKYPATERGDVLVFLSGISEISTVAEVLKAYADETSRWVILVLHSTLSLEEQDRVFDVAPEGVRKCILSTNIAETSVTIDGVRFVVDSGKVKEMRYESETKMHQLKETWISQASAEQRKGRAGRTGPGVCYRLYSQAQFDELEMYTTSEIKRVSLESLVLQMYNFGLSDPRQFEFIEPPDASSIERAVDHLKDQAALTANELLTPLGQMLVKLPVDVAIGKMLVMGCMFRQVEVILTSAAALSVQSPFTNRSFREQECLLLRKELASQHGDPFILLNTYREWLEVKRDGAESSRRWCRKRGIEEQRLYEITKLRTQFKEILEDADLVERQELTVSSTQRRIRQGELKQLRDLKRNYQNQQRKRKVLKLEHYDAKLHDSDNDEEQSGGKSSKIKDADVHSVEFFIRHTDRDIDERLRHFQMDHIGVTLLKFILCGALYPRYGVLDAYNNYKLGVDQMVHTKTKPFVVLHPNSCFGQDPEILYVVVDAQGRSTRHQLIFYSLLLETTKPYMVNSLRVSALHCSLLFARTVDTSLDFTRIVCDRFVEFQFATEDGEKVETLVIQLMDIRQTVSKCLERKLDGDRYHSDSLAKDIVRFFDTEIFYSLKRLMKADLQNLYVGPATGTKHTAALSKRFKGDKQSKDFKYNPEIGGVQVNDYLNIGCLSSAVGSEVSTEGSEHLITKWICPKCREEYYFSSLDRLEHIQLCKVEAPSTSQDSTAQEQREENESTLVNDDNPLKKHYFCDRCNQQLLLTPTEILKHRRSHK